MLFGESSPTPLRTTWYQLSQREMRGLSNCLKSCQIKQWLILYLRLISFHFSGFFLWRVARIFLRFLTIFSPSIPLLSPGSPPILRASIFLTHILPVAPPDWGAGAPCRRSTGPDPLSLEFRVFSPLLVHGHTLLENILKLCPNTKYVRCLWCLNFSFAFKLDW